MRDTDFEIDFCRELDKDGVCCIPFRYFGVMDKILGLPIEEDVEPKCSTLKKLILGETKHITVDEKENEYHIISCETTEEESTLPEVPRQAILYIKTYSKRNNILRKEITYDTNLETDWLYTFLNVMALLRLSDKNNKLPEHTSNSYL